MLSDFQDFSLISSDFQYRALANTLTPLNWLDTEMECRMKAVYIFIVTLWMMILPHHVTASDLDAVTKTQLQTTMITFLEAAADEAGAFGVIDRETLAFVWRCSRVQFIRALCLMELIIFSVSKCSIERGKNMMLIF